MFEVPLASLTMELHCLHTATSASLAVFHLHRLKCAYRSDFPLVFGTRVYLILCVHRVNEKKFFLFRHLQHFPVCFSEITMYTGTDKCTDFLYHLLSIPVKPVYQYKPPAPCECNKCCVSLLSYG